MLARRPRPAQDVADVDAARSVPDARHPHATTPRARMRRDGQGRAAPCCIWGTGGAVDDRQVSPLLRGVRTLSAFGQIAGLVNRICP